MAGALPRPGVEVVQEFTQAAPSLIPPILPPVAFGKACQVEEDVTAGVFNNITADFTYPDRVAGANVDLASVVVKLVTATDTFDISDDPAVTIAATKVTIAADPAGTKSIVTNSQVSPIAGATLTDTNKDFFAAGVKVGDTLLFEDVVGDLVSVTSKVSQNLGTWTVTRVTSQTKIELLGSTPGHITGTATQPFGVIAGNNDTLAVDIDGAGTITVVLTPGSGLTAQNIADDLNADGTFAAVALADVVAGKVRIRSLTEGDASSVEIGVTSPSANTLLGFTALDTDTGSDQAQLVAETNVEYKIDRDAETTGTVKLSYTACRTDQAAKLFTFRQDTAGLQTTLGKIDPANPLAYALFWMMSATDLNVHGVIVTDPDDAVDMQTALDFLSSKEVYALVPLSQDDDVLALMPTHVDLMSEPENKRERIAIISPIIKDFKEYAASQTATTPVGATPTKRFTDTGATFLTDGVPVGAQLSVTAVTKTLQIDSVTYTPTAAAPTEIQIAAVVSETEVDIIATNGFTLDPGNVTYSVKSQDYSQSEKALNQAAIAEGYNNRRIVMVQPDVLLYDVDGTETELPAYYGCAAVAGMISGLLPSQGFTTLPVVGPTGVKGSNDVMSELDLDFLAGGGVFILIQEVDGGPVTVRHQLTTAVSDLKTRELSVIKAVDYASKFFRTELAPLIGRYNLTEEFMTQQLRPAANGVLQDLIEERIVSRTSRIVSMKIVGAGDEVEVVIDWVTLFPVNKITVVLQI